MASKGDILVNSFETMDHYINPCETKVRHTHAIGIVRTLRRNGDASKYDSFQGAWDWDSPKVMRQVPATGVYIVSRSLFGSLTDAEIAQALGGRSYANLDAIRQAIRDLCGLKDAA